MIYSTAGAFLWSILLVWAGVQLGANWDRDPAHALQPFDLLIAVIIVVFVALFIWLRLGRPGWRRRPPEIARRPDRLYSQGVSGRTADVAEVR